jgi:hypothetical protein
MPAGSTPHLNLPYRRLRTSRLVVVPWGRRDGAEARKRPGNAHGEPALRLEDNRTTMGRRDESLALLQRRQRHPVAAGCLAFSLRPCWSENQCPVASKIEAWPPVGPLPLNLPCCRLRTSRLSPKWSQAWPAGSAAFRCDRGSVRAPSTHGHDDAEEEETRTAGRSVMRPWMSREPRCVRLGEHLQIEDVALVRRHSHRCATARCGQHPTFHR